MQTNYYSNSKISFYLILLKLLNGPTFLAWEYISGLKPLYKLLGFGGADTYWGVSITVYSVCSPRFMAKAFNSTVGVILSVKKKNIWVNIEKLTLMLFV